jgi:hypothetical protein
MWSHYARHHTGFVVGFHAAHEFFGPTVSPVIYSSDRPKVNPFEARHEGALAYTKSEHWKYEQEYRKFKCFVEPVRLSNGNWLAPYQKSSSKRETNNSVVLFPFPADSIAKVILGWKSTPELHSTVVASLETHNLGHIPVLFARPSPTLYEMELAPQRPEPFHWPPQ